MTEPAPAPWTPAAGSPHAGFGARALATLLDGVVLSAVTLLLGALFGVEPGNASLSVLGVAYFSLLEGSPSGQTVGKKALGIRVLDLHTGRPIGPVRAMLRHLARTLSALALLLGYLWMLWDREHQTWHDKLLGAVVVRERVYPVSRWPGW